MTVLHINIGQHNGDFRKVFENGNIEFPNGDGGVEILIYLLNKLVNNPILE